MKSRPREQPRGVWRGMMPCGGVPLFTFMKGKPKQNVSNCARPLAKVFWPCSLSCPSVAPCAFCVF